MFKYIQKYFPNLTIEEEPLNLNDLFVSCQKNEAITQAVNLEDSIDERVDLEEIIKIIEDQLSIVNDTYDDIVTELNLEKYIQQLDDFELPSELNTGLDQLNAATEDINSFSTALDDAVDARPNDQELKNIQAKATKLTNDFETILNDASSIIEKES